MAKLDRVVKNYEQSIIWNVALCNCIAKENLDQIRI